jgi:hypothetical protein
MVMIHMLGSGILFIAWRDIGPDFQKRLLGEGT